MGRPTNCLIPDEAHTEGLVLVVEDNLSTGDVVYRYLRHIGYPVVLAVTGNEGLCAARASKPRAVIVDYYHLPDMDGLAWINALRREYGGRIPGVVLITADWEVADRTEEIAAAGAILASKPCDLDEVERLVSTLWRLDTIECRSRF